MPEPSPTEVRDALIARAPAPDCIASERFVLPDPLPPRAFIDEVGRLRRALLGEFDRPDPSVALELARLYLGHGLGAEAHQILAEFAAGEPEAPLLASMSRLSEGRPLPSPSLLDRPDCGGQHALWQALDAAVGDRPGEAAALLGAADGALEQMTHGLRGRVAARLGIAAAEAGDWIAAHRLEAMAKRALAPSDRNGREMAALLGALVLRERGDVAEARRQLASLAEARSPAGAEALLTLADSAGPGEVEAALPLERMRLDLGTLARAHRGGPLGLRAFRAEVVTTARLTGRDAAFDLAVHGREAGLIEEADYREILAEIGRLERGIGDTPLAVLYENEPERFARLRSDGDFRVALARSYLSLGAPTLAERVLRPEDLADGSLRRDLAAAYLELGDQAAARRAAPQGNVGLAHSGGEAVADRMNAQGGPVAGVAERARAAWASGNWRAAVETLRAAASAESPAPASGDASDGSESGRMRNAEAARLALRLAIAAKRAGLETPPPEALGLAADRPALDAGLRALFGGNKETAVPPSPEALAGVITRVSEEIRMYREVVEDG